jgi:predicted nuclease of restriction endonuclease-like (RecB) superfamily
MNDDLTPTTKNIKHIDPQRINSLYQRVAGHVDSARQHIHRSIDVNMLKAYWLIGKEIIEEEQYGEERSEYGKAVLKGLSIKMVQKYKKGFSVDTLEKARKFYLVFQLDKEISATVSRKLESLPLIPNLSWSHYVELLKVTRTEAMQFYALEASKNNWNVRELRRQISSFLYDRLSKSKNKKATLEMSLKGHEINTPQDAIKEPLVLEFMGAPQPHKLSERNFETALIDNLQYFLLELGKGFAFMGRQKRITFDNDHYYADLVFYHVILKCYVIVDLKTHKLTHADLGQMQLYVNYYDCEIKMANDSPTIGLVLCTQKSNAMVKYMLGENTKQIFASTYQFHLPSEQELVDELKRELSQFEHEKIETAAV